MKSLNIGINTTLGRISLPEEEMEEKYGIIFKETASTGL